MKDIRQTIKEAHGVMVASIRTIFDNEYSFKEEVLGGKRNVGWNSAEYSIERCHAANCYRVTLLHKDGRMKDIYIDSNDVYGWIVEKI